MEVEGHSAIALLLSMEKMASIGGDIDQLGGELVGLDPGFLEAENMGAFSLEPVHHALLGAGPDAVDVPGCNF